MEKGTVALRNMITRGIQHNGILYNASISTRERGLQWKKALQLLRKIKTRGMQPNVILYNASISTREKKGLQWKKVR